MLLLQILINIFIPIFVSWRTKYQGIMGLFVSMENFSQKMFFLFSDVWLQKASRKLFPREKVLPDRMENSFCKASTEGFFQL